MYVISPQVGNRQTAKPAIINVGAISGQKPIPKQTQYVPEPRPVANVEYEETQESSSSSSSSSEDCLQSDFCSGEGYVLLEDEEGSKFRFRLVSEPNPNKLTHSLERILKRIRKWFRRSQPISQKNISDLGIFCANSALTLLGSQQGLFIGTAGIPVLATALNALKIAPHLNVQISSRLIAGDILLLNINLGVTANAKAPGTNNPLLGIVTLSGHYHIVDSGAKLLIDNLTVFNNSPRKI